jgi:demethylmenaquinone methyltransferase / 2-methoxy-6-polyprenyl-1,4-benzoquinol methylase
MELDFIQDMFDAIAHRYDLLNRLLSLRQDVFWRRAMISAIQASENHTVLDVACGTADVMIELLRQQKRIRRVVGVDFSFNMLQLARAKLTSGESSGEWALAAGNGLCLPFQADTFNAATIAFGIRNIVDRKSALAEFHRVLRPGGTLAVLELTTPESPVLQGIYLLYFQRILPKIGALFSKHLKAYAYLPQSVIQFPKAVDFAAIMKQAGFGDIKWRHLTLGVATLFVGRKPAV